MVGMDEMDVMDVIAGVAGVMGRPGKSEIQQGKQLNVSRPADN
jgi:hypothetical protein